MQSCCCNLLKEVLEIGSDCYIAGEDTGEMIEFLLDTEVEKTAGILGISPHEPSGVAEVYLYEQTAWNRPHNGMVSHPYVSACAFVVSIPEQILCHNNRRNTACLRIGILLICGRVEGEV